MKQDKKLYWMIAEFFISRINLGFYEKGDKLPSVRQICVQFCVSDVYKRQIPDKM